MKNLIIFTIAFSCLALTAVSCGEESPAEVNYTVTLDASNTYKAGDPVRFNIGGSVDNVLFYSGETGSQYIYKDRYSVPLEQVNSAALNMRFQARYGLAGALDVYISKDFKGLKGNDAAADKATIKSIVDSGMDGWTKLDYKEGASTKWTEQTFDVDAYLDNFCIAIHWHPVRDGSSAQRTYWIDGGITLDMQGTEPTTMDFSSLNFISVMMNDEIADPYVKNGGNGTIIFNKPATADIIFQGAPATAFDYGLDGWVFSTPTALNKVANDKGTVIKNLQNYPSQYEYTYAAPGTYTASFVGINADYMKTSRQLRQVKLTIVE